MFTGLVEGCGTVFSIEKQGAAVRLTLELPESLTATGERLELGDSLAINGCCLTVVEWVDGRYSFEAGEETLSKTSLGALQVGDAVNVERALPVNGRLGGHFVQGHVDGVGEVRAIERDGEWVVMRFRVSAELARLLVPKGSVAIDGVSLTVVDVTADQFHVALIPHTLEVTTLGHRQPGDRVNIETDILGKYVDRLLSQGEIASE